jgi:hypothetical protein
MDTSTPTSSTYVGIDVAKEHLDTAFGGDAPPAAGVVTVWRPRTTPASSTTAAAIFVPPISTPKANRAI